MDLLVYFVILSVMAALDSATQLVSRVLLESTLWRAPIPASHLVLPITT